MTLANDKQSRDVSRTDGQLITTQATRWIGTKYAEIGIASQMGVAGDCSGSTYQIYKAVGFQYEYRFTGSFPKYASSSGLFRQLDFNELKQDGDIVYWPHHMAIYSSFGSAAEAGYNATAKIGKDGRILMNDMWTAHHTGGAPYGPAVIQFWDSLPTACFRFQKKA